MRAWEFIASSSAREVSVVKDTAVREVEVELRAIAGYVAVEYDGKWWIACVDEIFPHSNEVSVNFLHPHGPSPSYFYPRRPDSLVVDVDDILVQYNENIIYCLKATSIQTFDFSTPYTSIPHDLLKSRMNNIINNAFKHKNGATRYTHIKVGRNKSHFTSDPLNDDNKYTANDICKMIEFLVDNIYIG